MRLIKLDINFPDSKIIQQAAHILESGGIVIHPTDTTYGLAANIYNPDAIAKIFEIKGRDFTKPLIVCVRDLSMAKSLAVFNKTGEILFENFLPGPLTIVLSKKSLVSDRVSGGLPDIGVRIPNCQVTFALSKACSVPYTTTSANLSGNPDPYSVDEITSQFNSEAQKKIDLLLDCGQLPIRLPSTVVSVTGTVPKIFREGPIASSQIFSALKG